MVYVESYEEAAETGICELHTQVCKDLDAWCAGKYLWRGERRKQLRELLQMIEDAILDEKPGEQYDRLRGKYRNIWFRGYFR